MSGYQATEHELWLLDQARYQDQSQGSYVVELAKWVSLVPRVEPLLLRNVRMAFLPQVQSEAEFHLWFSPLVSTRSTQNFILHRGVAGVLARELRQNAPDMYGKLWEFCIEHTRHWKAPDARERDLRYAVMEQDRGGIENCLREVLNDIHNEKDEDKRIDLALWAKRNLPVFVGSEINLDEVHLLAQYSASALGDTSKWTELSRPQPLPNWLSKQIPTPISTAQIGLKLHFDAEKQQQVIECLHPSDEVEVLPLNSPLPSKLFIQCNGTEGKWEDINIGSRILLPTLSEDIRLTTLEGQQFKLTSDIPSPGGDNVEIPSPIYLTYVKPDAEQAHALAQWFSEQGLEVELLLEQPGEKVSTVDNKEVKLLRLWTRAAQYAWEELGVETQDVIAQNILLRTEEVSLPEGASNANQLLDMIGWQPWTDKDKAEQLLEKLQHWEIDRINIPETNYSDEIQMLLDELNNFETIPPRRLEIGDILAEMGDPRPGVGLVEVEVIECPPEIQSLLDELNDIKTEPPRRLEIGDVLAEMGDPRPGAGLDENGLPDIDWVKIPAGEFIYGEDSTKKTLKLDTFFISRFTITNAQYQAFIVDGGYEDERWWQNIGKTRPEESRWPHANRPKTNVNWYEAIAFCRWLSDRLGYEITLPTEQQWEKNARGSDGWNYPWGGAYLSGYANVNERGRGDEGPWHLEQTTAVGVYSHGASPYGICDLAGNVWEWGLNKYERSGEIGVDSSGESRVLRGGTWNEFPVVARASFRFGNFPSVRYGHVGFRVCCALPSSGY